MGRLSKVAQLRKHRGRRLAAWYQHNRKALNSKQLIDTETAGCEEDDQSITKRDAKSHLNEEEQQLKLLTPELVVEEQPESEVSVRSRSRRGHKPK